MFGVGAVLVRVWWGQKQIQNAPKKLKMAITSIHLILLKLGRKSDIINTYETWPGSTLEKLNFALQLKVSKNPLWWRDFINWQKLTKVWSWGLYQGRSHFNFRTKQGPKISVSHIRDIAFYRCSEIIRTRNFTVLQFLDNLWRLFIFSNYIEEINHFTLDLLKRSNIQCWNFEMFLFVDHLKEDHN